MILWYVILLPLQRCTLFVAAVYKMRLEKVLNGVEILHSAAQPGYRTIIRLLCKWGTLDKGGNTILHIAAQVNAVDVCEMLMAMDDSDKMVATKNDDGKTPIHLAAMHSPECLEEITLSRKLGRDNAKHIEWFSAPDSSDCTPLDIAAKAGQKATFAYMWDQMENYSPARIDVERGRLNTLIENAEKDPSQWQRVIGFLNAFPKQM